VNPTISLRGNASRVFSVRRRLVREALGAVVAVLTIVPAAAGEESGAARRIAGHAIRLDAAGHLLPWTSWAAALDRELRFYAQAPLEHGYPRFVVETFLDGEWNPDPAHNDTIPATQNGMGIISYLKLHALRGRTEPRYLATARAMGDYLVTEALTPDEGNYPRFPRSTGTRGQFPLAANAGTQADRPFEIEADKGGIAAFALVKLFETTGDRRYFDQALHDAHVLAAMQAPGDRTHSPWPFRADFRDGKPRGPVSGNTSFILRLYDVLLKHGHSEFTAPQRALWQWIKRYQIPSASRDGALFAQFFEDHEGQSNRTAWAPLNLARYLLERRSALDPDWRKDSGTLIEFVRRNFTHVESGVTVCHEQDEDREAWGGVNSTYGAVLALYARAIGSRQLADEARGALDFTLYSIDEDGRPRDLAKHDRPGGWQEDAHTDVIHNYLDAERAYPKWADAR